MSKADLIQPTPERLSKAEGAFFKHRDKQGRVTGGTTVYDQPIERMREENVITRVQHMAAMKFYAHWYGAGMQALKAINYARAKAESAFRELTPTEEQEFHAKRYREACLAIGPRDTAVVQKIVCEGQTPVSVGRSFGWTNDPQARAVSVDRLRGSLDILSKLWGFES